MGLEPTRLQAGGARPRPRTALRDARPATPLALSALRLARAEEVWPEGRVQCATWRSAGGSGPAARWVSGEGLGAAGGVREEVMGRSRREGRASPARLCDAGRGAATACFQAGGDARRGLVVQLPVALWPGWEPAVLGCFVAHVSCGA